MADVTEDDRAVENFQKYLRIPAVHTDADYDSSQAFITGLLKEIGLPYKVYEFAAGKPVIVATLEGAIPELSTVLFNSHMDVVPVYPELWTHDPFGGEMDSEGNIFGRGSQDMKSVTIQYLEAVRRIKKKGTVLKRTVHFSFVPDEEIGGDDGMKLFAASTEFKKLFIGCAFDEGTASEDDTYYVYYAERTIWQIKFLVNGTTGHGSLLLPNTPGEKIRKLIDRLDDFRQTQVDKLNSNPELTVGDVTTVNLTILEGGVQANVVPPLLAMSWDMRIAIDFPLDKFEEQLHTWVAEAGEDVQLEFISKEPFVEPTKLDNTNPFWVAFKDLFNTLGYTLKTRILNGGTDGRFIRKLDIPVLGFSPMARTPVLMHGNDEFLNKTTFLRGIDIYEQLIPAIANVYVEKKTQRDNF